MKRLHQVRQYSDNVYTRLHTIWAVEPYANGGCARVAAQGAVASLLALRSDVYLKGKAA